MAGKGYWMSPGGKTSAGTLLLAPSLGEITERRATWPASLKGQGPAGSARAGRKPPRQQPHEAPGPEPLRLS